MEDLSNACRALGEACDGVPFKNPSPSLEHCTGSSINGWLWIYGPTGKTLNQQCNRK